MSIQQSIASDVYKMAGNAQTPDQIKALQQHLTKSVQDGAVPSYVGIPLLQSLNDRLRQVSAMSARPQDNRQPPIAEQVIQQAEADTRGHGVDTLPSNLPAQAMREGGIVAFADGGDVDYEDDYDDQGQEEEEYLQALQMAMQNGEMGAELEAEGISALPSKEKSFVNRTPNVEHGIRSPELMNMAGGSGIEDIINQAAKEKNLPPELMRKIAMMESGMNPNAANKNSSAKGLYQFIDSTWAGMGGRQGEQLDPSRNAELGAAFTRQNAEYLKNALGRDPTYSEVYAAHFFGAPTAKRLAMANQNEGIDAALGERARQVISANPHLRGKTVGDVFGGFSNKMGDGIVALAQGGGVKHFFEGGSGEGQRNAESFPVSNSSIPAKTTETYEEALARQNAALAALNQGMPDKFANFKGNRSSFLSNPENAKYEMDRNAAINAIKGNIPLPPKPISRESAAAYGSIYGRKPNVPIDTSTPSGIASMNLASQGDIRKFEMDQMLKNSPNAAEDSDQAMRDEYRKQALFGGNQTNEPNPVQTSAAPKNAFDSYMDRLAKREEGIAQQKEEDKYMALLTAGLGMMGGTSPFAMSNIGQGALAGVANYGQSAKQRAAEQNAIERNMVMAQRYKDLGAIATQNQNLNAEQRKAMLELRDRELAERETTHRQTAFNAMNNNIEDNIRRQYGNTSEAMTNPNFIAQKIAEAKSTPEWQRAYKNAWGFDPIMNSSNTVKYDSSGKKV